MGGERVRWLRCQRESKQAALPAPSRCLHRLGRPTPRSPPIARPPTELRVGRRSACTSSTALRSGSATQYLGRAWELLATLRGREGR